MIAIFKNCYSGTYHYCNIIIIIIIIIIKNECHSNIIVDRLQGCSHSKKLRESESESRRSKVVWQARCQL